MRITLSIAASCWFVFSAAGQNLPDGPGKEVFAKVCAGCHELDLATGQKKSKDEWKQTVDRMIGYGAELTKEQSEQIVNYLAANYGTPADAPKAGLDAKMMPEGPGKEVILRECTTCHAPSHFVQYRHTEEEWQAVVTRMGQRAKTAIKKEDLDSIQKYLASNFPKVEEAGKVNVNKAPASEIATQLALTPAEAAAIVQYREKHGQFLLWGELLGIYGVDGRKVEAAKDRMSF
ncbi:MAG: helix-hairpin-helix domain-containing protein [Bryobacterales bacterium]|nr:helix-hairpin-helix domain-containing protein [Bryobacterales bacterium]MBV9399614.1 helix-hairpin-helix domain-containing protein [Bryobacterales bacterium]